MHLPLNVYQYSCWSMHRTICKESQEELPIRERLSAAEVQGAFGPS